MGEGIELLCIVYFSHMFLLSVNEWFYNQLERTIDCLFQSAIRTSKKKKKKPKEKKKEDNMLQKKMDSSATYIGVTNGSVTSAPHNWTQPQDAINFNPQAEDCYYYFYSMCNKGAECKYRHCSAALGSEHVCEQWRVSGSCSRPVCAFRHTAVLRQRSIIPCYWESQPQGCQKPHCPFLHAKPRPQPKGALHRLEEFRMSSIKVKSLDELKRERQMKETEEKIKEDERKLQQLQKDLDIRHELMKRILAEKESFKKRQEKERTDSKKREKAEVASISTLPVGLPSTDYISLVTTSQPIGDVSKKKHVRPTDLDISLSSRKKKKSSTRQSGQDVSSKKQKLLQDHSRNSKTSQRHNKVEISSSASSKSTAAIKKPSLSKSSLSSLTEPLSPPSNGSFKVKTLEELKKERSTVSQVSKPAKVQDEASLNKIGGDKDNGGAKSVSTVVGRKKVILLRHRRTSGASRSDKDGDEFSDDQGKPPRKASGDDQEKLSRKPLGDDQGKPPRISLGGNPVPLQTTYTNFTTTTASTTGIGSGAKISNPHIYPKAISKSESHIRLNPIPTSKSKGNSHSIPESAPCSVTSADSGSSSRKHRHQQETSGDNGAPSKRRKLSLVRKERQPTADKSHDQRAELVAGASEEEDVDRILESAIITEAVSITDLKNELFRDIEDTVPTIEDHALLEEMAQLEDNLLEGDDDIDDKDNPLTHSRSNDDELLLQMEELM